MLIVIGTPKEVARWFAEGGRELVVAKEPKAPAMAVMAETGEVVAKGSWAAVEAKLEELAEAGERFHELLL